MKKLILYNHMGDKLLDFEVFVEGQDFNFEASVPTAIWLGKICLVDKEPEPVEPKSIFPITSAALLEVEVKEEKVESAEINNQDTGDRGLGEASQPESIKDVSTRSAEGKPFERSKKPRKRKAA